jgi:uncharacterized protein YidB (DUF937 family)
LGEAMPLIHEVIEDLRGLRDAEVTPIEAAPEELLRGERGSVAELADRLTEAELGHIMITWMGRPALPMSAQELRSVLGEERVADLATVAGRSSENFLAHPVRLLPTAVHRMTPEGSTELLL